MIGEARSTGDVLRRALQQAPGPTQRARVDLPDGKRDAHQVLDRQAMRQQQGDDAGVADKDGCRDGGGPFEADNLVAGRESGRAGVDGVVDDRDPPARDDIGEAVGDPVASSGDVGWGNPLAVHERQPQVMRYPLAEQGAADQRTTDDVGVMWSEAGGEETAESLEPVLVDEEVVEIEPRVAVVAGLVGEVAGSA